MNSVGNVIKWFFNYLQELLKVARGILNKITPSKFDKLLEAIKALNIDTEDRLAGVIRLFFEKVICHCKLRN